MLTPGESQRAPAKMVPKALGRPRCGSLCESKADWPIELRGFSIHKLCSRASPILGKWKRRGCSDIYSGRFKPLSIFVQVSMIWGSQALGRELLELPATLETGFVIPLFNVGRSDRCIEVLGALEFNLFRH